MSRSEGNPQQLMTPADLAERWQCSVDTVMQRVKDRGVPLLWLGSGPPRLTGRGRMLVRFRPSSVEAWEVEQEVRREPEQEGLAVPLRVRSQGLLRGQKAWVWND